MLPCAPMALRDLFRRKRAPQKAPRDLFAEELLGRVRQHPEVTSAERVPDSFELAVKVGEVELRLSLDNLFAETREVEPSEKERLFAHFLQSLDAAHTPEEPWEAAAPRLRLVVRAGMSAALQLDLPTPPVTRELVPGLCEQLVVDDPSSLRYVNEADLQRWKVTAEEAMELGRRNLTPLTEDRLVLYDERPVQLWHLETGDDYEAARVLAPGFLASLRELVEGAPVLIIPTRSLLFVGGAADPAAVKRLAELAEREYFAGPRELSYALYTVGPEDRLVPYLPEGADDAAVRARLAHAKFLGSEYTRQQQELEALYAQRGTDRFVPGYKLIEKNGRPVSFCTWPLGVEALLPRADYLVIGSADPTDKSVHFVPWEAALRLAGAQLTVEPRLFPTRWRTATEVPAEVHAALLAAAEPL